MKFQGGLSLPLLALSHLTAASTRQRSCVNNQDAIIDTVLTFTQSLDDKSESLLRSATAANIIFDGTLFADIGIGALEPLVGQDSVVLLLQAFEGMSTSHHLTNFRVTVDGQSHANFTAYAQAYHYSRLEEPRENPKNIYLMGNRYAGGLVKADDEWKLDYFKIHPVWQSGNIAVMGITE